MDQAPRVDKVCGRIFAELYSAGKFISRFVYSVKPNVPSYLRKGTTNYKIVSSHLGSPRLVVNASTGTVEQRITYDVLGKVTLDTNPGYQPFSFAGGLWDADPGIVRFGARDYDPKTGRWTAKDPILFSGMQANLYGYSFSDPVNYVDANGMNPLIVAVGIGALVGGSANLAGSYLANTLTPKNAGRTFGIGAVAGGAAVLTAGTAGLATATSFTGILTAPLGSGFISTLTALGIDVGLTALANPPPELPKPCQ